MEQVKERFTTPWIEGDAKVNMEILSVLAEKSANFTLRDVPTLCMFLDQKGPATSLSTEEASVSRQTQDLEDATFTLVMKKVERDVQAWAVHKQRREQWNHRLMAKKSEHILARRQKAALAID
eukprot:6457311-Amphidinium_carterae.1